MQKTNQKERKLVDLKSSNVKYKNKKVKPLSNIQEVDYKSEESELSQEQQFATGVTPARKKTTQ